jgi:hypothetical protein
MDKSAIDVAMALVRLSELTIFELRGEWRRLHRMPPPMRLSRDLLVRGIAYKLQERAYGGPALRKLEQAAADPGSRSAAKPAPPISLRPGTRLVREWHGVTHTALRSRFRPWPQSRPVRRAGQDLGKGQSPQPLPEGAGIAFAAFGQRQIGPAGVLPREAPGGLAVPR